MTLSSIVTAPFSLHLDIHFHIHLDMRIDTHAFMQKLALNRKVKSMLHSFELPPIGLCFSLQS